MFFRFQGSRRFIFYLTFGDKERDCRRVPLLKNGDDDESSTYLPYLLQVQLPANYTTIEWMQTTSPLSAPDSHSTFRKEEQKTINIYSVIPQPPPLNCRQRSKRNFDFIWSTLHKELTDRRKAIILLLDGGETGVGGQKHQWLTGNPMFHIRIRFSAEEQWSDKSVCAKKHLYQDIQLLVDFTFIHSFSFHVAARPRLELEWTHQTKIEVEVEQVQCRQTLCEFFKSALQS